MVIGYLIVVALPALALTRLPAVLTGKNLTVVLSALSIVAAFALITPVSTLRSTRSFGSEHP